MSLNHKKLKQDMVDVLRDAPFINHATKKVGVSRNTFYRWMRSDRIFKINITGALAEGHKCMIELTESALFKKIKEGHFGAIKFYLENNHGNYMNRKYRIETLPDRNYEDSPAHAHARIPKIIAFDKEEMGYIERIRDSAEEENMSEEDVEKLIDMVINGKFKEAIEQYDKQEEPENE